MTEMIDLVASWQALSAYGTALFVFGFAPGFVLRVILWCYPREDLRRAELLGELYAMPRGKRPMWVAQQIETGLFEGLSARHRARRRRRQDSQRPLYVMAKLANGREVRVEEIVGPDGQVTERVMERYGIARRRWYPASAETVAELHRFSRVRKSPRGR